MLQKTSYGGQPHSFFCFYIRRCRMIKYFDVNSIDAFGSHPSQTVLRGTNGARMGVSLVASESYSKEESHDDQEGLFFVEGTGYAKFDGVDTPFVPVPMCLCLLIQNIAFGKILTVALSDCYGFTQLFNHYYIIGKSAFPNRYFLCLPKCLKRKCSIVYRVLPRG